MKQYLEERRTRNVFVKDSGHPILQGLPAQAFAQWRGEPDKTVPYPRTGTSATNGRFMHWGSRGTVATFVQDKPDSGRFRVLLDCDADLSRSALLENFIGDGRILFCMLDLEERLGLEPMADELAVRLFHCWRIRKNFFAGTRHFPALQRRRDFLNSLVLQFPFPPESRKNANF